MARERGREGERERGRDGETEDGCGEERTVRWLWEGILMFSNAELIHNGTFMTRGYLTFT